MDARQRTALAGGILLILLGACLLLARMSPDFQALLPQNLGWPLSLVGVGLLLLVIGLVSGTPAMAVPACVVAGIGLILNYQVATGDWGSWLYMWALIPGFAGFGTVLAGILGMNPSRSIPDGLWTMVVSLALFLVFSSIFGGPVPAGPYWPVLLIALGLVGLIRNVFFPRRPSSVR
jgi:hypothetical protein